MHRFYITGGTICIFKSTDHEVKIVFIMKKSLKLSALTCLTNEFNLAANPSPDIAVSFTLLSEENLHKRFKLAISTNHLWFEHRFAIKNRLRKNPFCDAVILRNT